MLALSAYPLGFKVRVLAGGADEPAAQVCGDTVYGSLSDERSLRSFTAGLDVVTFESEFVDTALLSRCLPQGVRVFPSLQVIGTIQDRLTQKQLLDRMKIPTSPWLEVNDHNDLKKAAEKFRHGFVLKQRRFGYDGYGTFVYRDTDSLDMTPLKKSGFGFIAEAFVDFKRELATSFVRSPRAFRALPLVESVQKDSRCFSVQGPVKNSSHKKMISLFKKLMQETGYEGILAAEFFETKSGLLVNELAPRVHNSAHYTQDALTCDQFEYHWRGGLDLPLPEVELLRPGFAMVNLLGEGGDVKLARGTVGHLHWYGKSENRAGRKLGHINTLDKSGKAALTKALKWRKDFAL